MRTCVLGFMLLGVTVILPTSVLGVEPVRIGVIVSNNTEAGQLNLLGAQVAVRLINESGGVGGRPLELVVRDDEMKPAKAVQHALELADREDITVVMGSSFSEVTLPIVPIMERAQKILITPFIGHDDVTHNTKYVFRPIFRSSTQADMMAEFAVKELNVMEALILKDTSSKYSTDLCSAFVQAFTRRGGRIVGEIAYDSSTTDFSSLFEGKKEFLKEGTVYLPGHDPDMIRIILTLDRMNLHPVILGAATLESEAVTRATGNRVNRAYYPSSYYYTLDTPGNEAFVKVFKAVTGKNPTSWSASWYDAVFMVARVLEKSSSWTPEALRKAFLSLEFQGVSGSVRFKNNGDAVRDAIIMEIRKGVRRPFKTIVTGQ